MQKTWFERAQAVIPGGVNSPVRAFGSVGGEPLFFQAGQGAYVIDQNQKRYVDYVCTWGATVLGHASPLLLDALETVSARGFGFGAPSTLEVLLAEKITELMPAIEMVRMVNSGTEATMSAIRLARGFTGRDKIIKFAGCYHGHSDSLLVQAGSGSLTFGLPSSAGVPVAAVADTLVANFNDLNSVKVLFEQYGDQIAAVLVEPVAGNMNCVLPAPGFLQGLRDLCTAQQSLLIFDEVMTGFRVALGGAQAVYAVKPDLTTLGKIIGGGLPVGAFGGRSDIMSCLSPLGPVYQAGTLSGNPLAMAVGLAQIEQLSLNPGIYDHMAAYVTDLLDGLTALAHRFDLPLVTQSAGAMFGFAFADKAITTLDDVMQCDKNRFNEFFHHLLSSGIYLAPSAYEAGFVTGSHTEKELALTLAAAEKSFSHLHKKG